MIAWEFGTYYCWVLIATLYSIIAILNVMRKIHREAGDLAIRTNDDSVVWVSKHDGQKGLSEDERPKTVSEATLIVRRVAWYPVVLIACSLVNMASDIQVSFMSMFILVFFASFPFLLGYSLIKHLNIYII